MYMVRERMEGLAVKSPGGMVEYHACWHSSSSCCVVGSFRRQASARPESVENVLMRECVLSEQHSTFLYKEWHPPLLMHVCMTAEAGLLCHVPGAGSRAAPPGQRALRGHVRQRMVVFTVVRSPW